MCARIHKILAACVLLFVWALPARADVLMPGYRPIPHRLVLEAHAAFDTHEWWAFPTLGFGGATQLAAGVPFEFSGKYGTRVYAIPKGAATTTPTTREAWAVYPSAAIPVEDHSQVPLYSTLESIVSRLSIQMGEGAQFTLIHSGDETQRNTSLILAWCASVALGSLGLLWFWKRRQR
jgi:hypothetical protein